MDEKGGFEMSNIIKRIDNKMKILNIKPFDKLLYILQLAEEKLQDKIDEQKMSDDMYREYLYETKINRQMKGEGTWVVDTIK